MANVFGLMNIAQSSLTAQQKAIDVTGSNIANVNTPGYTRQRVNIVQKYPAKVGNELVGRGVTTDPQIQRFYDQFLNGQLNGENQSLGRWEAQHESLQKVEMLFDDMSGYGLSTAMSEYFNAWQDLASNPDGVVQRSNLISAAQYMTDTFNQMSQAMTGMQNNIDTHVDSIVDEVNAMAEQVAELNLKIVQQEALGHSANAYRDDRDQLVFEMSKMINVTSFEDGEGNMTVMVGNGKPLVESSFSWDLATVNVGGVQNIEWQNSSGIGTDITAEISSGELKGWIETRDVLITDYSGQLDLLAETIINEVNGLHAAGLTLDNTTGVDFFTGTNASSIAVNSAIVSDSDLIAAASAGGTLPGDNTNANAIANLRSDDSLMPGNSTFDEYYNALVGSVGSDVQAAGFSYRHQDTMVLNLKNYRQEVSGVSLDEEMVNLIQHQHAYDAAARMINTASEMLDTLMRLVD